jgi:hypothetical protein
MNLKIRDFFIKYLSFLITKYYHTKKKHCIIQLSKIDRQEKNTDYCHSFHSQRKKVKIIHKYIFHTHIKLVRKK